MRIYLALYILLVPIITWADLIQGKVVLGMVYATGKAVVKIDTEKTIRFLTEAAQKGDQQSITMLEMMRNN